jgi:hypothetical protein
LAGPNVQGYLDTCEFPKDVSLAVIDPDPGWRGDAKYA